MNREDIVVEVKRKASNNNKNDRKEMMKIENDMGCKIKTTPWQADQIYRVLYHIQHTKNGCFSVIYDILQSPTSISKKEIPMNSYRIHLLLKQTYAQRKVLVFFFGDENWVDSK